MNEHEPISKMTNAQLAWEFLRRNEEYISAYRNFNERCRGPHELKSEDRVAILKALKALGAWRPRYEPWINAALLTGKEFIKFVNVNESYFRGCYYESERNLDPMQFLLREWIDPKISPLPIDREIFDRAGALSLKILRKGSYEFLGAFRLGLIDGADDGTMLVNTQASEGIIEAMYEDELPANHQFHRVVRTLYGFPQQKFSWEADLERADDIPRALAVEFIRDHRRVLSQTPSPIVDTHKILRVHDEGQVITFDLHANLQFDLTLPLRDQVAAALVYLTEQQEELMLVTDKSFKCAYPDIQVPNVNGVYKKYLALLDAYDRASEGHGRLQEAIRVVSGEPDLNPKEPRYTTLAKAFSRASAIRDAEYRSLAFI